MNYIYKTDKTTRYNFPTHINDLVMDRSEASFSEVFVVIVEPEKAPPIHKHDDTEQIFHMLEGVGTLRIGQNGEESYKVTPGDVVRIPVSTWHSIKADNGEPLKYLAIDCFGNSRNEDEPTWESHVKVVCKLQNWDFDAVKQ
ncbi:cupin domain-containing protein [Reichenbachiella sp. MALMAid0571]|uniref:cupin domain-containing protein n=1 Tax=Reichenbachiella sp. MALMAid0571 TaxID=3143939 RepID=UPI0032DFEF15